MNNQRIKRFLKIIDNNIDKIEEEAIKAYKESFLQENNNIRIYINLAGNVEALTVPRFYKYIEDIHEREVFVCEFNKERINIDELLGELYYLNDYEEFKKWCNDEEENLSWDNYKTFNKDNFDELVERHIEDSLSNFIEELNEGVESRKQELKKIVEN